MRFRTIFLSFLFILTLCLVLTISSALADVTGVYGMGDGSAEVYWNSNDDEKVLFVYKTGEDFQADFDRYGYFWLSTDGKSKMMVYIMAPGQSYWVLTENTGSGFTTPYAYNVGRASNYNEFKNAPTFNKFFLKMRSANGSKSDVDYFIASDLENENSYDSYGLMYWITWPQLRTARTYLWQFVLELPDGYRYVLWQGVYELPVGGYFWREDYLAIEDAFHLIYNMRNEVPRGRYTVSLYWDGQHVCSQNFMVR